MPFFRWEVATLGFNKGLFQGSQSPQDVGRLDLGSQLLQRFPMFPRKLVFSTKKTSTAPKKKMVGHLSSFPDKDGLYWKLHLICRQLFCRDMHQAINQGPSQRPGFVEIARHLNRCISPPWCLKAGGFFIEKLGQSFCCGFLEFGNKKKAKKCHTNRSEK